MTKHAILLLLLHAALCCTAQTDSSGIDSEVRGNPGLLDKELIELEPIRIPASAAQFAGIRFVDARADTSCIGFISTFGKNRKVVLPGGLAAELNSRLPGKKTDGKDSLIVYIKKFWLNRRMMRKLYDERRRVEDKRPEPEPNSFCHIAVAYFVKTAQGMLYCGKTDTVIAQKTKLYKNCRTISGNAVETVLQLLPAADKTRYYTEAQVETAMQKNTPLPDAAAMPNGLFLSYADFKNGIISPGSITLSPRIGGYKVELPGNGEQAPPEGYWGLCYNNQFYIRCGRFVNKLWKSGHTYLCITGIADYNEESINSNQVTTTQGYSFSFRGMNTDSKYGKRSHEFLPAILNPLTGRLE